MSSEIAILAGTAVGLGFIHTLTGPDHYIPFIALARARQWHVVKTVWITALCGLGHVLSSIALGTVGIGLGIAVLKLQAVEAARGELAGWLLLAFGLTYTVWGVHRALRNQPHRHTHVHVDGDEHQHEHGHTDEHTHVHASDSHSLTPWVLFILFVFGPCEPLIPLVMYPAARHSMAGMVVVSVAFGVTTILTMLGVVLAGYYGLSQVRTSRLERYTHALAGLAVLVCGIAVKFAGL